MQLQEVARKTIASKTPIESFAKAYLSTYWPPTRADREMWLDNFALLMAYRAASKILLKHFARKLKLLDISTGPTLGPLLGIMKCVEEAQLTDFQPDNRECLETMPIDYWLHYVLGLYGISGGDCPLPPVTLAQLDALRSQNSVLEVDLFQKPIFPVTLDICQFDLVTMHFVADSITQDVSEYFRCLESVISLVQVNSAFVMSALVDTYSWQLEDRSFPSPNISAERMASFLRRKGFEILHETFSPNATLQVYSGKWVVFTCIRRNMV